MLGYVGYTHRYLPIMRSTAMRESEKSVGCIVSILNNFPFGLYKSINKFSFTINTPFSAAAIVVKHKHTTAVVTFVDVVQFELRNRMDFDGCVMIVCLYVHGVMGSASSYNVMGVVWRCLSAILSTECKISILGNCGIGILCMYRLRQARAHLLICE